MEDLEIGLTDDGHIIISMDGLEPTCWVKLTEDEALATAMVIMGQIIQLRKRRKVQ
jgi:hypothetical protein